MKQSFKGAHHIAFATGDLERTIRFWRDLLRMRLIGAFGKSGYKQYFFEVSDRCAISFFEWKGVQPVHEKDPGREQTGPFVFDHIALEVQSEDELWELKDRLEHNGEWVSEVIDHGIIYSIYTFDPNGIALEFTYQKEGMQLQQNPLNYDKSPSPVASEGIEPQIALYPDSPNPTAKDNRRVYKGLMSDYIK
jgi:catechol 2,3-dioxygenase-like lactoylglutathione lyase family enzyme